MKYLFLVFVYSTLTLHAMREIHCCTDDLFLAYVSVKLTLHAARVSALMHV
jgi:hypothetical protein